MRLVINAASAKMGGNVNYVTNLLRTFAKQLDKGQEFLVFLPPATAKLVCPLPNQIRVVSVKVGERSWWKRLWWEQVTLRRRLNMEEGDALFSTGSFGMFWCPARQLLLVRNALYFSRLYRSLFLNRHGWAYKMAFRFRRRLVLESARAADIVIAPTRAMLEGLRQHVALPAGKCLVNPYGAPSQESYPQGAGGRPQSPALSARQPVRLLYVSLYSEHKNLGTLLEALPLLNRTGQRQVLLLTTADPRWEGGRWTVTHQKDASLAAREDISPRVRFVGPVDREAVRALYQEADIFIFPSLVESFGFPMVEAMAWGLPIVASDTPVNREVCGEAALYFDPLSSEQLADQVRRVEAEESLRENLRTAGRRRARDCFRWEDHARRILECAFPAERQASALR